MRPGQSLRRRPDGRAPRLHLPQGRRLVPGANELTPGRQRNEIQVTAATYPRLQDRYTSQPRGSLAVKGRGEVACYLRTRQEEPAAGVE